MAGKIDPRDFLLNTDYEMDKIIWFKEAKITPGEYGEATISHGLGFAPLVTGIWSKTSDFSEPHPFTSSGITYFSEVDNGNKYATDTVSCLANSKEVELVLASGTVNNPQRYGYYVRMFAFEPSSGRANVKKTSNNANKFILNTDYNYLKLHSKGILDFPEPDSQGASTVSIEHNLGYHPQALFWVEATYNNDDYAEIMPLDLYSTGYTAYISPTTQIPPSGVQSFLNKFVVYLPSYIQIGNKFKLHYRIYYDEA